jgi:hypothetical protein
MLTDERLDYLFNEYRGDGGPTALCENFARAIEAEATAPLLARIAELEADAKRWRKNQCFHDEYERLGSIWTRCTQCGLKWADDDKSNPFKSANTKPSTTPWRNSHDHDT